MVFLVTMSFHKSRNARVGAHNNEDESVYHLRKVSYNLYAGLETLDGDGERLEISDSNVESQKM